MKHYACSVLFSLFILQLFLLTTASGKLLFVGEIPNGNKNKCSTCHLAGEFPAKTTLNPFGKDFRDSGKRWITDLAKKDSDGDGVSNGKELGDPDCSWKKGNPDPSGATTNPGDPASR